MPQFSDGKHQCGDTEQAQNGYEGQAADEIADAQRQQVGVDDITAAAQLDRGRDVLLLRGYKPVPAVDPAALPPAPVPAPGAPAAVQALSAATNPPASPSATATTRSEPGR